MYKHSLKDRLSKIHSGGIKYIQLKYQKPHSSFLTCNFSEEQFTPPRKDKLLDVESKTLTSTDVQHLGNSLDKGEIKSLFPMMWQQRIDQKE